MGDVIRVRDNQILPADCLLLATHSLVQEDDSNKCFTNTQTLDGETNLKPKLPIKALEQLVRFETKQEVGAL